MTSHLTSSLLVVLAIIYSCPAILAQKACGKDPLHDMDELISTLIPFNNPKVKAPQKLQDLPKFCSYYGNALSQVEDLNKRCVKGDYKSMFNLVVHSIRKHTKEICSKKSLASNELTPKKKSFFILGGCIHSGEDQLKKCAANSKIKMLGIQNADKDKKLGLLCCELGQLKKCLFQTLTQQQGCNTESAAQKMRDFVAGFGTGSLSTACADFSSEDKCRGMVYPKKKKSQRVPKSFIIPVLTLIDTV